MFYVNTLQSDKNSVGKWILREIEFDGTTSRANVKILGEIGHEHFPDGIPGMNLKWISKQTHEITYTQRILIREYTKQKQFESSGKEEK